MMWKETETLVLLCNPGLFNVKTWVSSIQLLSDPPNVHQLPTSAQKFCHSGSFFESATGVKDSPLPSILNAH